MKRNLTRSDRALLASAQDSELLTLGAETPKALLAELDRIKTASKGISLAELTDLCAQVSRQVSPDDVLRAAVVAGSPDELAVRLEQLEIHLKERSATA